MGKGGGDTTSTVYQSNLPSYAKPYYQDMMGRAQSESTRPYQPYGGQRIADMSGQTTSGLGMAEAFARSGSPDLDRARALSGDVASSAMDLQNYVAGGVDNTYLGPEYYAPGTFSADQANAERVGTGTFGAAERDQYMSPYMQSVVEASQTDAAMKAAQEQAYIKAQQGTSGAFGGSRGGVQQQIAANEAQRRISDIGVQGRQSAFENAQQQFERDQARGLTAQTANQRAALEAQLANQKANLEAAGMGEESRQFGYQWGETGRQKAAELGMTAQSETEKLRQSGKQLGLEGLKIAGDTAGQMAGYQDQSDQMAMDRFKAMLGVGQTYDDRAQKGLDIAYEDFLNQTNWPRQNLSFLSSLLASTPQGQTGTTTQTTPSNPVAGTVGSLMGLQALQNLNASSRGQTG